MLFRSLSHPFLFKVFVLVHFIFLYIYILSLHIICFFDYCCYCSDSCASKMEKQAQTHIFFFTFFLIVRCCFKSNEPNDLRRITTEKLREDRAEQNENKKIKRAHTTILTPTNYTKPLVRLPYVSYNILAQ